LTESPVVGLFWGDCAGASSDGWVDDVAGADLGDLFAAFLSGFQARVRDVLRQYVDITMSAGRAA
jgi:hypothetical protein